MKKTVIFMSIALLAFGCITSPVLNMEKINISSSTQGGDKLKIDKLENAILVAAKRRGWRATVVKSGLIEASINVRTHKAIVEISYNIESYSILYKDSVNLKYDGEKIHKSYNSWIVKLSASIDNEINKL